jgi:hypothetical protein
MDDLGRDRLELREVSIPEPARSQVLVRLALRLLGSTAARCLRSFAGGTATTPNLALDVTAKRRQMKKQQAGPVSRNVLAE